MKYKLSKRSYKNLNGVNSILIAILTESIKNSPYDFGVPNTGGLRSAKTQNKLYRKGASKLDGYIRKSKHQAKADGTSHAFDIYAYVNGKASWKTEYLTAIANHILFVAKTEFNVNLKWGGHWSNFVDMPHYEL